jgi:ornithine carbamoyltransferase
MATTLSIPNVTTRQFLSILDLEPGELDDCLGLACRLKRERATKRRTSTWTALAGSTVAMVFDKPSLRTRTTFEIAIRELGGEIVHLPPDLMTGDREPLSDVARNLERWVDAVVIRTSAHKRLLDFSDAAPRLHVINALTDEQHPCQALADLMTLRERWGSFKGRTLAFVGDGNNVAASLAHAGLMAGLTFHIASPEGYELPAGVVEAAEAVRKNGARIRLFRKPEDAVQDAHAVYTDVWASMGQERERDVRSSRFKGYQVNEALMSEAQPEALFMHCLPAHRGQEVTSEVIDGPHSVVLDQAENRLHTEKALLLMLLRSGLD